MVQVRCIAPRLPGVAVYRLGVPRDRLVEVLQLLRHGRSNPRRLLQVRQSFGDRSDGFLVAVEVGDDAAFGLGEMLSERILRRRPCQGGALVPAPSDFVPQARDVLPQTRILVLELLEFLQLLEDFEQELAVGLRATVRLAVRCLPSLKLAFRFVGVGPVVRHG